jgi:hypothetical protein
MRVFLRRQASPLAVDRLVGFGENEDVTEKGTSGFRLIPLACAWLTIVLGLLTFIGW